MDITVKTLYYYLKGLDGNFHIFERQEITGPYLSAKQLYEMKFEDESEAQNVVENLNAVESVVRKVTI